MAKCVKCGRGGMGILHQAIKLNDGNLICHKCYKELGGSPYKDMTIAPIRYSYNDIKDGFEAYHAKQQKQQIKKAVLDSVSVRVVGGGRGHDLICTEEEREIYDTIRSLCDDANYDSERLSLVRRNDEYVTIIMTSDDGSPLELARLKYTVRAKWIRFCPDFKKIELIDTEDITNYTELIYAAYAFNEPYL